MATLIPLPSTRVSNLLIRDRLLQQLQGDQLDIFRLQNQVSTGRRINVPSDDAPAALRSISLQRLMERKSQLKTNVASGQSYLAATDTALSDVATTLGNIRGSALGVAGTTASASERQAVATEVSRALEQLVETANRNFRGRYLFAGSKTDAVPYTITNGLVHYAGDDQAINNYSDLDVLFAANASGVDVFGGISSAVLGDVDLNPHVSADTLLSSLRGGRGISSNGSIFISDGTNGRTVDLSSAATVGDVARLIEKNPPPGRTITATITGSGINLQLDSSGGGNLTVNEVGAGTLASELGIRETAGVGVGVLTGDALDPSILKTTRLGDLLGSKARARLVSPGNNNDLFIEAAANGAQYNGATVQLVDDELLKSSSGLLAGHEVAEYSTTARAASAALKLSGADNDLTITANSGGTAFNNVRIQIVGQSGLGDAATAAYDSGTKRLTITVDSAGATTVQKVVDAIALSTPFTATADTSAETSNGLTGTVAPVDIANLVGDTGNSGGAANTLYVRVQAGASTANQIAAAINSDLAGVFTASIDQRDTASFAQAGTQVVALNATATTSGGSGAPFDKTSGLRVVNGGKTTTLTFENADTVEDLLNVINGSDAGLFAEINADGTGVNVRSRLSGGDFQIGENGGQTATQLGIRSFTGATSLSELNYGDGVETNNASNFTINSTNLRLVTRSGQAIVVDLTSAATVDDVRSLITSAAGPAVTATVTAGELTLTDNTIGTSQLAFSQSGAALGIAGGVTTHVPAFDFSVTPRSGTSFNVDLSGAQSVQDAIDAINAASGGSVTARLATSGNGIELIDNSTGAGQLTVTRAETSQAAEQLGLIPAGATTATATSGTLRGSDQNFLEVGSVFTTLTRLRTALQTGDINDIERAIGAIDGDIERVTTARSDVGARQQALDLSGRNLEDEDVQLQTALSSDMDVDLVEAISNLVARQTSLQASLQTTASILKLSLLDFL